MRDAQLRIENALDLYKGKLPRKPYFSNDYTKGKKIGAQKTALNALYIQPNSNTHKYFITLDIDSDTGVFDWYDKGLPAPQIIARNLDNGRAHMSYILNSSVKMDYCGSATAIKYCCDVEHGLAVRVGADMNYNGILTKNPFNAEAYKIFSFETEAYDLGYLNEFVDKDLVKQHKDARRKKNLAAGFASGRNCNLFENLRLWAYKNWHKTQGSELHKILIEQGLAFNNFDLPLDKKEVVAIASSVYRFMEKNFSLEILGQLKSKRAKQSREKSSGNVKYTDGKPWEKEGIAASTYYYRKSVSNLKASVDKEPWKALGISRSTYFRRRRLDNVM
ncbi:MULTISPECIES: replication initiation protein [Pseudomonas]|uniref:Primase C-terminal 1 domain-containing protein n=1 Tax=Pseudomonas quercus TaxID=2722792 RepID=A0ABX0YKE3_9PSED|nr:MULTISPECIES: replication initiation protein [Pseudomonas]MBF7143238.1 replication initiation protein [Pseudomonas sp. LY10J]NJP03415.1 hypothetical protein [Pseudomonas quercus]